jgi:hypothetical protein
MRVLKVAFFLLSFLAFGCVMPASAGSMFPCVKAFSSSNGNFFVMTNVQFRPGNTFKVQRVSLQVFPKETFTNDQFAAPATYWTDFPQWSVILEGNQLENETKCPLALITNDGEFLVLVHINSSPGDDRALQIYQRRDHIVDPMRTGPDHGIFIKAIPLKEIWPPGALGVSGWNNEVQWFAGGSFAFSSDSRQLIHKTRWGNMVRINLPDGSVLGTSSDNRP